MNKNYKTLLFKQGMLQVKHEMEQEYKDHNLFCNPIILNPSFYLTHHECKHLTFNNAFLEEVVEEVPKDAPMWKHY